MADTMKIRFYSIDNDTGVMEMLEEATDIPSQEQADALAEFYQKTVGRINPNRTYFYSITQPLDTAADLPASVSVDYNTLMDEILTRKVTAKMEHIPEKPKREYGYCRLILQAHNDSREVDTDGYWDENIYYLTCFCFDFTIGDIAEIEVLDSGSTTMKVYKEKMSDDDIINMGLGCAAYNGDNKPSGLQWKPQPKYQDFNL